MINPRLPTNTPWYNSIELPMEFINPLSPFTNPTFFTLPDTSGCSTCGERTGNCIGEDSMGIPFIVVSQLQRSTEESLFTDPLPPQPQRIKHGVPKIHVEEDHPPSTHKQPPTAPTIMVSTNTIPTTYITTSTKHTMEVWDIWGTICSGSSTYETNIQRLNYPQFDRKSPYYLRIMNTRPQRLNSIPRKRKYVWGSHAYPALFHSWCQHYSFTPKTLMQYQMTQFFRFPYLSPNAGFKVTLPKRRWDAVIGDN